MSDEGGRYAAMQASLAQAISEATSFTTAASKVLQTVCQDLGWDVGCAWRLDESGATLRFVQSWHDPDTEESELERMSARVSFSPGVGLPGRILAMREPAWIRDVQVDRSFPRGSAAAVEGIRGAFGFPIGTRTGFLGVMEFFCREVRERDEELLRVMGAIGEQFGPLTSR